MKTLVPFAVLSLFLSSLAGAQTSELMYVAWQGGSREKVMKEEVFPRFQAKFPVRIQYVVGVSTELLAKLQAQRTNQEIDVVMLDDGPMYQASAAGLCAAPPALPMADRIYDIGKMPGTNAVGIGIGATGLAYNKKIFAERGWAAPTSWKDIEDAKYKNKLSLLSISNTFGLHALVMAARINGGSEKNIEPGFKALSERVTPNVQAWVQTAGGMSAAFQSGDVALAVWSNGRTLALADTGFPIEFVYPKEGAVATLVAACAVKKQVVSKYSAEFIKFLLTPEIQRILADEEGLAPVNRDTKVSARVAAQIPVGEPRMKSLVSLDWNVVNDNRTAWTRRWMREVEKK